MFPAEKLPEPSLSTMEPAVFPAVAVVAELATFPDVLMVASLVSVIAAVSDILLLSIAPGAIAGVAAVPLKSPANCTFPLAEEVASGVETVFHVVPLET